MTSPYVTLIIMSVGPLNLLEDLVECARAAYEDEWEEPPSDEQVRSTITISWSRTLTADTNYQLHRVLFSLVTTPQMYEGLRGSSRHSAGKYAISSMGSHQASRVRCASSVPRNFVTTKIFTATSTTLRCSSVRGTVKLMRGGRDDPSMARNPSSFSRHTSPHPIRPNARIRSTR